MKEKIIVAGITCNGNRPAPFGGTPPRRGINVNVKTVIADFDFNSPPWRGARRAGRFILTLIICAMFFNCGIYSLSGSTLPTHLKTVELPVFGNSTLEPGIESEVTAELSNQILKSQLRPANRDADATIGGTVTRYAHRPHTFGAGGAEVSVELYIVQITADVLFQDNKKDQIIFKGSVSGEGTYDFANEEEQVGREKAVKDLVEKIIQNSVQMW